jgi:hypothetical protein
LNTVFFAINTYDNHIFARFFPGSFKGSDRTNRHFVVMRINGSGIRVSLEQRFGDLPTFVAGEITGLGRNHLHIRILLDFGIKALFPVVRGGRTRGTFELDNRGLSVGFFRQPISGSPAFLNKIRPDERQVVTPRFRCRIDAAIQKNYRDAGLFCCHYRRNERLLFSGRKQDDIHPLGDHAVHVSHLFSG